MGGSGRESEYARLTRPPTKREQQHPTRPEPHAHSASSTAAAAAAAGASGNGNVYGILKPSAGPAMSPRSSARSEQGRGRQQGPSSLSAASDAASMPLEMVECEEEVEYETAEAYRKPKGPVLEEEEAPPPPWFKGRMDPAMAQECVAACMVGDFLVRDSSSSSGYVMAINDYGRAVNFPIARDAGGNLQFAGKSFTTLEATVAHMVLSPLRSVARPGERLPLARAAITAPWFARGMSRAATEAAVTRGAHGTFAVRISSTKDKYVLVVNDKGAPFTFSITCAADGARFVFGGKPYPTVEAVCEGLRHTPFRSLTTHSMRLTDPAMLR